MQVENVTTLKARELKRKKGSPNAVASADFATYLTAEVISSSAETTSVATSSPLGNALEVNDYSALDQTLKEKAHSALKMMKTLQAEMLQGEVSLANLHRLSSYVNTQGAKTTDLALHQVLQAIKTRAAVEIAKLEVGGS